MSAPIVTRPTPAELLATAKAEGTVAVAFAKSIAKDDAGSVARVNLIADALAKGLSVRKIAARIGVERARLAHPGEDDSTLIALGSSAPYSVSSATVDNYAQAVKLMGDAGVLRADAANVLAAYKLVCRSGSSSARADLAARVVELPTGERSAAFVAGVTAALLALAAEKKQDEDDAPTEPEQGESESGDEVPASADVVFAAWLDATAALQLVADQLDGSQRDQLMAVGEELVNAIVATA